MNSRHLIMVIVVIVVLAVGSYLAYTQFLIPDVEEAVPAEATAAAPTDVDAISVNSGLNVVTAEGLVVPLYDTQLSFPSGGEIVEIFVTEGDLVRAGGTYVFDEVESLDASEAYKIYYSISESMLADDSELTQTEGY